MKKENECQERCIECDPENTLSLAEQYRISTAKMLLSKMGYIEMADGNFVRPDLAPKDGKKQK